MSSALITIGSTIGLNLISNLLFELGKAAWQDKSTTKSAKEKIYDYVSKNFDSKYLGVIDTTAFQSFMESSYVNAIIGDYYNLKVYSGFAQRVSRKLYDSYAGKTVFCYNDLVELLTKALIQSFKESSQNSISEIPNSLLIRETINELLKVVGNYISKSISEEHELVALIINEHADKNIALVLDSINWFDKKLDMILSKFSTPQKAEVDYTPIVCSYMEKMRAFFSSEHVYLMDKYRLETFFVCPKIYYEGSSLLKDLQPRFSMIDDNRMADLLDSTRWQNIFDVNNIIYIIGGAGYGKSLFLKYMIGQYENMNILNADQDLVIYGRLSDYIYNDKGPQSIIEYLQQSMIRFTLMDEEEISKDLISYYIDNGKCIILLDALDEVPRSIREDLHSKIINYFKEKNPNNKICITTRSRGFVPDGEIYPFRILPISRSQIEEYVDNMIQLGRLAEEEKEPFLRQALVLTNSHFLTSFLTLSLLVAIYNAEQELPVTKLDLYKKCFEYIAMKREKTKNTKYDWKLMTSILRDNTFMELSDLGAPNNTPIATEAIMQRLLVSYEGDYLCANDARNAIMEFLRFCSERTEVFVPADDEDTYKFFHRSFYEYFYSKYIVNRCNTADEIYNKIILIDLDSEVFELVVAMLKSDAVQKCNALIGLLCDKVSIDFASPTPSFKEFNILGLTMTLITNISQKERIVQILTDNIQQVVNNSDRILVHNQLFRFISDNDEFTSQMIHLYKNYAYKEIYTRIERMIEIYNSFFHQSIRQARKDKIIVQVLIDSMTRGVSFFSQLLIKQEGIETILTNITQNWLKGQFSASKSGRKRFKQAVGHMYQALQIIKEFALQEESIDIEDFVTIHD